MSGDSQSSPHLTVPSCHPSTHFDLNQLWGIVSLISDTSELNNVLKEMLSTYNEQLMTTSHFMMTIYEL
jgi:hypothetical protein